MALEMLPFIKNQYYLAKAAEIAACQDNLQLAEKAITAINDLWFSSRATQYLNKAEEISAKFNICHDFSQDDEANLNGICEVELFYN